MTTKSFENWNFVEWLTGNWPTIKELAKVGIPFIASTFVVDPMWQQFLVTIVGKFVLDTGHYWIKDN